MLTTLFQIALQNRFAPLPRNLHIVFCIFATVLFIYLYKKSKKLNDLLWMLVCDMTLILQYFGDKTTAFVIACFEIILLFIIFIEFIKDCIKKKKEAKKADDDLEDIEKAVKIERSNIVIENTDDVIENAFDGDDIK